MSVLWNNFDFYTSIKAKSRVHVLVHGASLNVLIPFGTITNDF